MRLIARIMVPVLAIPVFLAFQIASPVQVFCAFGSCIITPDKLERASCAADCVAKTPDPEPVPCCKMARDTQVAPGRCNRPGKTAPPRCATDLASSARFPALDWDCGKTGSKPKCQPRPCRSCVPERYAAEPALEISSREFPAPNSPIIDALCSPGNSDKRRSQLHEHSPPLKIRARGGTQICLNKCSFLL
jgi:hypothetical protein